MRRTDESGDHEHGRARHSIGGEILERAIEEARANRFKTDWAAYRAVKPAFLGLKHLRNYDLGEIAAHIDWGPFFQTWDLAGPYPAILQDAVVGEAL